MCIQSKIPQIDPADGVGGSKPSSEMPKRKVFEASQPQERAKQRQALGSLRDLTVQPATRRRYDNARTAFFTFLADNELSLPTQKSKLDPLVCDYIEHLWSSGAGRALANDTVAALQDAQPSVRGHLQGAWRLLKTWSVNEIPNRAPPMPEPVLQALAGWAFFKGHFSFGFSLVIGFYTMLRSGEIMSLKSSHIMYSPSERQVLISLGFTKGGKRQGAAESVVLGVELAVHLTQRWKQLARSSTPLVPSVLQWRKLFNEGIDCLGLSDYSFRPYSLRRGGATWWFSKHQNLDRILVQGRWAALKTARIYLNEGLALLAKTAINFKHPRIRSYLQIYFHTAKTLSFSTLEPADKPASSGGRGQNAKSKNKRVKKGAFLLSNLESLLFPRDRLSFVGLAWLSCLGSLYPSHSGFGRVFRNSARCGFLRQ